MKNFFLLFFTIFQFQIFLAQNTINYDIPSPNAADLGRFGDNPVSYYTGKINIEIPLYEFTLRGVTLPITLRHDATGVLVNNLPGWTGHNWVLNAGGCITRVVQGEYDEYVYPPTANLSYPNSNYFQSIGSLNKHINQYSSNNYARLKDSLYYGRNDFSPDIFYFNMMGISGKFFMGNDGEWKVLSDFNIDVIFDIKNSNNYISPFIKYYPKKSSSYYEQPKVIKGFTLRDDNGTKFYFGGNQDCIEYTTNLMCMGDNETLDSWIANTWYLRKVEDRLGNILYTFEYKRGKFIAQFYNTYQLLKEKFTDTPLLFGSYKGQGITFSANNTFPFVSIVCAPVYLKSISIADGRKLSFYSNDVAISPNETYATLYTYLGGAISDLKKHVFTSYYEFPFYYLQTNDAEITQYQYNPTTNAKYANPLVTTCLQQLNGIDMQLSSNTGGTLNYRFSYSNENRMHLTKIKVYDNLMRYNGQYTLLGTYQMNYNHFDLLPKDYLTQAVDHWGYLKSTAYSAPLNINGIWKFENQRQPDTLWTKYGTLTSIVYPTGGVSEFCYEQNDFSKCMSLNRQNICDSIGYAGGVRIKSISEYDNISKNKLLRKRMFEYKDPNTKKSSGELFAKPTYYWDNWETECRGGGNKTITFFQSSSIIPLSNSFGPHYGYTYVNEIMADGSKAEYMYSNISTTLDIPFYKTFSQTTPTPYDAFSERGYKRGKLYRVVFYDNANNPKKTLTYNYRETNLEDYCVWTSNLRYIYGDTPYLVGGIYKLFYPKYDVIAETTTHNNPNGNIVEKKTYDKEDRVLSVNSDGYTRHVDVRKTTQETILRGNNENCSILYYYPYCFSDNRVGLINQFYLPPVKTIQNFNGQEIKKNEIKYKNISGFLMPAFELENRYGCNITDTLVTYLTYSNSGALTSYQQMGKPVTNIQWIGNDHYIKKKMQGSLSVMYTYNESFSVTSITLPNGDIKNYEYDSAGRLSAIKDKNQKTIKSFEYNYSNKE